MFGQTITSGVVWQNARRIFSLRSSPAPVAAATRAARPVAPATHAAHPARNPRRETAGQPPPAIRTAPPSERFMCLPP
jgi:hypothetical protein